MTVPSSTASQFVTWLSTINTVKAANNPHSFPRHMPCEGSSKDLPTHFSTTISAGPPVVRIEASSNPSVSSKNLPFLWDPHESDATLQPNIRIDPRLRPHCSLYMLPARDDGQDYELSDLQAAADGYFNCFFGSCVARYKSSHSLLSHIKPSTFNERFFDATIVNSACTRLPAFAVIYESDIRWNQAFHKSVPNQDVRNASSVTRILRYTLTVATTNPRAIR